MQEEENYNYEELRKVHRNEKFEEDLQNVTEDFYIKASSYISQKIAFLGTIKDMSENRFSDDARISAETELNNARRVLKDIYERREKKILLSCLSNSRTNNSVVDLRKMLEAEKDFYSEIVEVLKKYRNKILTPVLVGEAGENVKKVAEIKNEEELSNKIVGIIEDIPSFKWNDEKVYGPFKKGDIANIPKQLAELLINQKKASDMP